jgi:cell wall-associated NlpC family hydrolase
MAEQIKIPDAFWNVSYDGSRYPGAPNVTGVQDGANCQQFAYELLRRNGFSIADLRSSDLWEDSCDTAMVTDNLQPGDLLLFHTTPEAWGAHVALYLGDDRAIHLAKHIGKPVIWKLAEFTDDPRYVCFIGAKRPICRNERLS